MPPYTQQHYVQSSHYMYGPNYINRQQLPKYGQCMPPPQPRSHVTPQPRGPPLGQYLLPPQQCHMDHQMDILYHHLPIKLHNKITNSCQYHTDHKDKNQQLWPLDNQNHKLANQNTTLVQGTYIPTNNLMDRRSNRPHLNHKAQ